jgi:hypothetical protein
LPQICRSVTCARIEFAQIYTGERERNEACRWYLIVCGGDVLGFDVHHQALPHVLLEASELFAGLV